MQQDVEATYDLNQQIEAASQSQLEQFRKGLLKSTCIRCLPHLNDNTVKD